MSKLKINRSIAGLLTIMIVLTSLSPLFAKKAEAQWITWDPGNFVPNLADNIKDYGLDAVAWTIVNHIIERMSASTVKWINGGFKGKPAFLENPERFFGDVGKKVGGQFIFTNPKLDFLCSPIRAKIRIALSKNFVDDRNRWQCTLDNVGNNLQNFMDDFEQGGWDTFFELTQKQQNNPIGAYIQSENEMYIQIANKQKNLSDELNRGNGFLNFKQCVRWNTPGATIDTKELNDSLNADFNKAFGDAYLDPEHTGDAIDSVDNSQEFDTSQFETRSKEPSCAEEKVNTPGGVISEQLNKTLGLGGEKLAVADEINEIVSALLNQLTGKIIGGIGKGLRSLTQPDSSNGNQIFNEQLSSTKPGGQIVGYFCFDNETDPNDPNYDTDPNTCAHPDTPNTEILNQPPFDPNVSPTGGTLVSPDTGQFLPTPEPATPPDEEQTAP